MHVNEGVQWHGTLNRRGWEGEGGQGDSWEERQIDNYTVDKFCKRLREHFIHQSLKTSTSPSLLKQFNNQHLSSEQKCIKCSKSPTPLPFKSSQRIIISRNPHKIAVNENLKRQRVKTMQRKYNVNLMTAPILTSS